MAQKSYHATICGHRAGVQDEQTSLVQESAQRGTNDEQSGSPIIDAIRIDDDFSPARNLNHADIIESKKNVAGGGPGDTRT
jgi:hypothetical protein